MKRIAFFTTILVVTAMMTALAYGQEKAPRVAKRERLLKALNLTEEQREAIKDLTISSRKENINVTAKLKVARLDLMELMDEAKPDTKAINSKLNEITKLRATLMKNRIDHLLAMKKILTPEQWKKAKGMRLWHAMRKHHRPYLRPDLPIRPRCGRERF